MRYLVYLMTLLFSTAVAQNPTILQGSYISNVFGNSNFVKNPNAQTNVANVTTVTATVARSTTTPLVATSEFTVAIGTANGTATWATRTFDAGMKNQNCEARFTYRGFQATSKVQIKQSTNVVAELVLTPSATDPRIASINFPCGDLSTATTFVVTDTAILAGTNEIGGIYVGLATNMANVAQAETVVQASRLTSVQTIPDNTTTTIIYNNEALDVYGEFDTSTGIFTAKRAGYYYASAQYRTAFVPWLAGASNFAYIDIKKNNTTSVTNAYLIADAAVSKSFFPQAAGSVYLAVGDTLRVTALIVRSPSTDLAVTAGETVFNISRFPSASELVVTPERQNTFGGVSYAGNGDFTGTSAAITNVTDTNFGARTFYGGASLAGTGCGLTANDFGFCMTNVPPGTYQIAGNVEVGLIEAGSDKTWCNYKVRVGGTSLSDTEVINAIPHSNASNQFTPIGTGIIKINSFQPSLRVSMLYNKDSLADSCIVRSTGAGSISSALPSLQISPLDQPSNSALYVQGPVKAAATGAAIPAGYQGEVIQSVSTSNVSHSSPVSGTYYGPAGVPSVTLTPGVWAITAQSLLEYVATASATTIATRLQLWNVTDSASIVSGAILQRTETVGGGTITLQSVVNITANKVYKLEFGYLNWSGSSTVSTINSRGDQGSVFIRAVRLN